MSETVGFDAVVSMLKGITNSIEENHETLSKLDSVCGDGDHGAAMLRVVGAVRETIEKGEAKEIEKLLYDAGWAVMSAAGGSTSPLYGSLFMGMSEGVAGKDSLDCGAVADMLEAGQAKLRKQTKAAEGGKTLIDALVPAVKAVRDGATSGKSIADALDDAAKAAAAGAEATIEMKAAFGRARNLGDRTIGHADPGATSMSCLFAGLAKAAKEG